MILKASERLWAVDTVLQGRKREADEAKARARNKGWGPGWWRAGTFICTARLKSIARFVCMCVYGV
jgi:hypothetical protein